MFYCKRYVTPEATVVAACDADLLGKVFRDGEVVLNVSERYYGGEKIDAQELARILAGADIISLVGENAIAVAVDVGLAEWRFVKMVDGIPHLNIYRL